MFERINHKKWMKKIKQVLDTKNHIYWRKILEILVKKIKWPINNSFKDLKKDFLNKNIMKISEYTNSKKVKEIQSNEQIQLISKNKFIYMLKFKKNAHGEIKYLKCFVLIQ